MKTVIYTKHLPKSIKGKAMFPWVFISEDAKGDVSLLNHELIHIEQQKEMLIIFAYLWYSVEFLIRLVAYRFNVRKAYTMLSMEQEAKDNEGDITYTKRRDRFSFLLYI